MENSIYQHVKQGLEVMFGPLTAWQRPYGVRCQSASQGKITLYHHNIADGNSAELAVDIASLAVRANKTQRETLDFMNALALQTGRPVKKNAQYLWERVGISSEDHANLVTNEMRSFLGL